MHDVYGTFIAWYLSFLLPNITFVLFSMSHTYKAVGFQECSPLSHTPQGELQLVHAITVVSFPLLLIGLLVNGSGSQFWP